MIWAPRYDPYSMGAAPAKRRMKGLGMRATTAFLFLMLSAAVTGCGTYSWEKPGTTDRDFGADSQTCQGAPNRPPGDFDQCMHNLGWTLNR